MGRRHPNVIKIIKQSRARPRYLKPDYGQTKVRGSAGGVEKNFPVKSDDGNDYSGMYEYRKRAYSYWDAFFTENIPLMFGKGKLEAIARAAELTKDISPNHNVVVYKGGITKTIIRFYFAGDFSTCFYIKEDWVEMAMYKSEVYEKMTFDLRSPKERAQFDYEHNRLKWVERISLPTIYTDPPSG